LRCISFHLDQVLGAYFLGCFYQFLDTYKRSQTLDRATLINVAYTSLSTKLNSALAKQLSADVVDAVLTIRPPPPPKGALMLTTASNKIHRFSSDAKDQWRSPIDLHMIEIMKMQHRTASETQLVRGLVMDHGGRHPDMPKRVENAFILTLNVSLEYEKTCGSFLLFLSAIYANILWAYA
jgi:T-complex protein 1 subunit zeta